MQDLQDYFRQTAPTSDDLTRADVVRIDLMGMPLEVQIDRLHSTGPYQEVYYDFHTVSGSGRELLRESSQHTIGLQSPSDEYDHFMREVQRLIENQLSPMMAGPKVQPIDYGET